MMNEKCGQRNLETHLNNLGGLREDDEEKKKYTD